MCMLQLSNKCKLFQKSDNSSKCPHLIPNTIPLVFICHQVMQKLALWQRNFKTNIYIKLLLSISPLQALYWIHRKGEWCFVSSSNATSAHYWWATPIYTWQWWKATHSIHVQCYWASSRARWWDHCMHGHPPSKIVALTLLTVPSQF